MPRANSASLRRKRTEDLIITNYANERESFVARREVLAQRADNLCDDLGTLLARDLEACAVSKISDCTEAARRVAAAGEIRVHSRDS